jgi:hypothetical protein
VNAASSGGDRFARTADIRAAIKGREPDLLDGLNIPWRDGKPHLSCPYLSHADNNPSWRWDKRKARAFCTCHTGGHSALDVLMHIEGIDFEAAKLRAAEVLNRTDLIREKRKSKRRTKAEVLPPKQACNGATPAGCRLADYAAAKRLPIEFLCSLGLAEISYQGGPAIKIPYLAADGTEAAARFRLALEGRDRFRWRTGNKPQLYGLHRLAEARKAGYVVVVEGESDCHTLWLHEFPALGVPGNTNWNEARDAPLLAELKTIYVVIEPGQSGDGVLKWLSRSGIAPRAHLVRLAVKDCSALHLAVDGDPKRFRVELQAALEAAELYQAIAERDAAAEAAKAKKAAGHLILEPRILRRFADDLTKAGLVGEDRNGSVVFLALTTRLFARPVSVAIKGVSSGGKSFTVEIVLRFLPAEAYWSRTAMSERALAYSDENFRHRHLVIYEAAGMASDFGSYLIRSLLSEGRIDYELPEKTRDGMKPRVIRKDGPTGLIVTTTATKLHPENETRVLALSVKDTPEQTTAIMRALAREEIGESVDYEQWRAFQKWLETGERRVAVPFADQLAELIPPVAVRLRRDFSTLKSLIQAHALLHRERRERDDKGRIIATIDDDYAAVRELIADLLADGVGATVSAATRETVGAVADLARQSDGATGVSVTALAARLRLDKTLASRRVNIARKGGYLRNDEDRRGRPARLVLSDPLPDEIDVLPTPETLAKSVAPLQCCRRGMTPPPPPADSSVELAEIEI